MFLSNLVKVIFLTMLFYLLVDASMFRFLLELYMLGYVRFAMSNILKLLHAHVS